LVKKYQPTLPTRGKTILALEFPSCPLDAASALGDGAHSIQSTYIWMCLCSNINRTRTLHTGVHCARSCACHSHCCCCTRQAHCCCTC
jgi:hypothetical protein